MITHGSYGLSPTKQFTSWTPFSVRFSAVSAYETDTDDTREQMHMECQESQV